MDLELAGRAGVGAYDCSLGSSPKRHVFTTPDRARRMSASFGGSDQVDDAGTAIATPVVASHATAIANPCGTVPGPRSIDATRAGVPSTSAVENGVVETPACRPR